MKPMELIEQGRFLGEEFLLWLWMRGLAEGGTSGLEGDQSACFVDDRGSHAPDPVPERPLTRIRQCSSKPSGLGLMDWPRRSC